MKSTFTATLQRRSIRTFVGADEIPELLLTKPNGEYLMAAISALSGTFITAAASRRRLG